MAMKTLFFVDRREELDNVRTEVSIGSRGYVISEGTWYILKEANGINSWLPLATVFDDYVKNTEQILSNERQDRARENIGAMAKYTKLWRVNSPVAVVDESNDTFRNGTWRATPAEEALEPGENLFPFIDESLLDTDPDYEGFYTGYKIKDESGNLVYPEKDDDGNPFDGHPRSNEQKAAHSRFISLDGYERLKYRFRGDDASYGVAFYDKDHVFLSGLMYDPEKDPEKDEENPETPEGEENPEPKRSGTNEDDIEIPEGAAYMIYQNYWATMPEETPGFFTLYTINRVGADGGIEIANGAVTADKLAPDIPLSTFFNDLGIGGLEENSVDTEHIVDKAVTAEKTSFIKVDTIVGKNLYDNTAVTLGRLLTNGSTDGADGYYASDYMPVDASKTYVFGSQNNRFSLIFAFYSEKDTRPIVYRNLTDEGGHIYTTRTATLSDGKNYSYIAFGEGGDYPIPEGAKYFRISASTTSMVTKNAQFEEGLTLTDYEAYFGTRYEYSLDESIEVLSKQSLENDLKALDSKKANRFKKWVTVPFDFVSGKLIQSNGKEYTHPDGGYTTVSVKSFEKVTVKGRQWQLGTFGVCYFYDADDVIISKHAGTEQNTIVELTVDVPDGAVKMVVNGRLSHTSIAISGYEIFDIENLYQLLKPTGRKLLTLGDSITYLGIQSNGWVKYFLEKTDCELVANVAVGGARLHDFEDTVYDGNPVLNGADNNHNNVLGNQVQKIINNAYEEPDIIIIAIGTNGGVSITKDQMTEVYYGAGTELLPLDEVDRTTSAGAYRYCLETLHSLYPNAIIFWSTPIMGHQAIRPAEYAMRYAESLRIATEYTGQMLINTIRCGINGVNEKQDANGEYLADGIHPNVNGAKKIGYYIASEVERFLGNNFKEI